MDFWCIFLFIEIMLDNFCSIGEFDEQDFLDWVEFFNIMGQIVVVFDCQ